MGDTAGGHWWYTHCTGWDLVLSLRLVRMFPLRLMDGRRWTSSNVTGHSRYHSQSEISLGGIPMGVPAFSAPSTRRCMDDPCVERAPSAIILHAHPPQPTQPRQPHTIHTGQDLSRDSDPGAPSAVSVRTATGSSDPLPLGLLPPGKEGKISREKDVLRATSAPPKR